MRSVALALLAGCATSAPAPAPTVAAAGAPSAALQERAAALFDAAAHGDELRLKAMVDWTRWRTVDGGARVTSDGEAAALLSRIEAEPEPTAAFVDGAVHVVRERLARTASGPTPPKLRAGALNAAVAAMRRRPEPGTPPSLARLRTLAAESLDGTVELTYDGGAHETLLFAGNLLAGIVDAP